MSICRSGGIGRRKGLKIPRAQKARAGSIPASGTMSSKDVRVGKMQGMIDFQRIAERDS